MITYEKNEIYFTDCNVKCRLLFYGKSSGERNLCFTKSCKGKEALQNRKRQSQPSCYNKKNKKIWSHKAKAKEEYQVYLATYKKRKNKVYLFDGKNLKIYRLSNGKKLKQFKIPIAAGHNIAFDSKDNLYLSGYFNDDVYKIDAKGKIIWKSSAKEFGLADAYGLKYKKGVVTQYYEVSPTSDGLDIDKNYYACFNAADGTIVDYRQ